MGVDGRPLARTLVKLGMHLPKVLKALVPQPLKSHLLAAYLKPKARKDPDTYFISYHKSGRTWLRVLIGKALSEHYGFPDHQALMFGPITQRYGISVIGATHDGSAALDGRKYWELDRDKSRFGEKKVIFLTRDVRDLIVSSYHALRKRDKVFEGSLGDFIRSDEFGVRRILQFYKIWADNRHVPKEFLLIRYEELHSDAQGQLRKVLDFIGAEHISEACIEAAVEFARFDNMKRMEQTDFFQTDLLRPKDPSDKNSFKVRRGLVGGYKDELSQDDIDYIDAVIAEMGNPFV